MLRESFTRYTRSSLIQIGLASQVLLVTLLLIASSACRNSATNAKSEALDSLINKQSYVEIAPGSFLMGSDEEEETVSPVELRMRPQHRVQLTKPYELGKYEVTQAQWEAVMGNNPSHFKGANLPVENVSWEDIQGFLQRIQPLDDQYLYRLPTEAEWEYACRAGSTGDFSGTVAVPEEERERERERKAENEREGEGKDKAEIEREREREREAERRRERARAQPKPFVYTPGISKEEQEREAYKQTEAFYGPLLKQAWFYTNAKRQTHPVGQLQPNAWGLYDMHGNVWEWCLDWFDASYYKNSPATDPTGAADSGYKINRGGSWQTPAALCTTTTRGFDPPNQRTDILGFRLARTRK